MFHECSVQLTPQDSALLFGRDLCPLNDKNSIVSDLQEIENSATN
jgi:hypothetical protein